jgi:hypothetical protein
MFTLLNQLSFSGQNYVSNGQMCLGNTEQTPGYRYHQILYNALQSYKTWYGDHTILFQIYIIFTLNQT